MEIVLVRHGRPAPIATRSVSGHDIGKWAGRYNEAGLPRNVCPPCAVRELVGSAGCVLASDLPRSLESARLLASNNVTIDSDLREVDLPSSMGMSFRLPASMWIGIARMAWWLNCRRSEEPIAAARARARRAADRLCSLAQRHQTVAVIGHGVFNRLIARQLLTRGWKGPRFVPNGHWSASRFTFSLVRRS